MQSNYIIKFDKSIRKLFVSAGKISLKNPSQLLFFIRMFFQQIKAIKVRNKYLEKGIRVPPFLIFSITNKCNLNCKGCYQKAQKRPELKDINEEKFINILNEAKELGISIILLAGGEPLMRPDLLKATKLFPETVFPIFTNGTLIDEDYINTFKTQKNLIPILSIEGFEQITDNRRGKGVYQAIKEAVEKFQSKSIFFGISLTITRMNFDTITNKHFIMDFVNSGCGLFFFVEYTPMTEETENWIPTDEQREKLKELSEIFRKKYSALAICFPGDEDEYGGCLSSGRGFVHISAEGKVEPCPFAPFSDSNLTEMSLKEALQSKFLQKIRSNEDELKETGGGCVLWQKREWVKTLLNESGNTETS